MAISDGLRIAALGHYSSILSRWELYGTDNQSIRWGADPFSTGRVESSPDGPSPSPSGRARLASEGNRLDACMRYFSDFHNNGHVLIDGHGSELFGIDDANDEATTALIEIMPFALRSGDKREFAISIRDEDGKPVLKVVVTFEVIVPH